MSPTGNPSLSQISCANPNVIESRSVNAGAKPRPKTRSYFVHIVITVVTTVSLCCKCVIEIKCIFLPWCSLTKGFPPNTWKFGTAPEVRALTTSNCGIKEHCLRQIATHYWAQSYQVSFGVYAMHKLSSTQSEDDRTAKPRFRNVKGCGR